MRVLTLSVIVNVSKAVAETLAELHGHLRRCVLSPTALGIETALMWIARLNPFSQAWAVWVVEQPAWPLKTMAAASRGSSCS